MILVLLLLCSSAICNAELRTWTAVNGKEVEAEFVSNEEGVVKLKLKSGKVFNVPLNKLSKEDQNFLRVKNFSKESTNNVPINANLKYQIKGDAVTIIGCEKQISGSLIIPEKIKGKPVRTIGFGALANCVKVESITISKSVTQIETYAFQNCMNLFDITIPDNVISIGFYAFSGCWKLEKITIGKGVKKIGNRAFNARGLKEVTFLGDAPEVGETPFNEVTVIYRKPEAKGWKDTFGGRPVKLISDKPVAEAKQIEEKQEEVKELDKPKETVAVVKPKPEGVNHNELKERGEYPDIIQYLKGSDTPYTGKAFDLHPNGQKQYERNYKDGKPEGLEVGWHDNGQKQSEVSYKDGKENGLVKGWYENGNKKFEENYKDGKMNDHVILCHANTLTQLQNTTLIYKGNSDY